MSDITKLKWSRPLDFDWKTYVELNDDLKNMSKSQAKHHFYKSGIKENRKYKCENIPEDFDPKVYIDLNDDLKNMTEIEAKLHYETQGYKENRKYKCENIPKNFNELEYNELEYNELEYNELEYNELEYNELEYNELEYNDMLEITEGINIITYYNWFGLGQNGCILEENFKRINIPCNIIKLDQLDSFEAKINNIKKNMNKQFLFVLFCFNADEKCIMDYLNISNKYIKIGLWCWELSKFPFDDLNNELNEIWSISNFSSNAISNVSSNKVVNINPSVLPINIEVGAYGKKLIDLYNLNDKIVFLTFFDINSSIKRKNPFDLLDLFYENDFSNKLLIVKYKKGFNTSNELDKYINTKNIIFIDDMLNYDDLIDLYKICDIYIQTSKTEGQGRSIIEALQCGKRVFCVNYSSCKEFYDSNNLTYIDYDLVEIDCEIYKNKIKKISNCDNIKWAKMKKNDLKYNIEIVNAKQEFNLQFKNNIEKLLSVEECSSIISNRLHSLKKIYVDDLIRNKINKVINLENLLNRNPDLRVLNENQLVDYLEKYPRNKKYSYKNKEVEKLLKSYNIHFTNHSNNYFDVEQQENITFNIYKFKKCIFTTSNINYILRVNLLAKSIKTYEPDIEIFNIIVDDYSEDTKATIRNSNLPFIPIFLDELNIDKLIDLKWFCYQYDVTELNTASKPWGFLYLFNKGYQQVLYFDSDILIYNRLNSLFDKLNLNSFVLTPHMTKPLPDFAEANPTDNLVNRVGQFNLGFIGISNKKSGLNFVKYWCSKTKYKFNIDLENGIFTDQVWCNLIPSFYSDYYIERSYSYNIAYWNLAHRDKTIKYIGNQAFTKDGPIVFVHFSGVDINNLNTLSKHQNVLNLKDLNFKKLLINYIDLINEQIKLYPLFFNSKYIFDYYTDKSKITKNDRELVLKKHYSQTFNSISHLNPFDINNKNFIFSKINKYSFKTYEDALLYLKRPDLQIAFVDIDKFYGWKGCNNSV